MDAGLVRNQHQFCSCRIVLTPKSYFLMAETRHRPHQSSQYDAFPSQAEDQCFARSDKLRRNTVTYWTTADFANRETCSFIRLNDAFRKTLLQAAKKKPRKLTDHGKQLLPRGLISSVKEWSSIAQLHNGQVLHNCISYLE